MTAFEAIQIAVAGINMPKSPQSYTGKEKNYIVYNYDSDHGADFGDDEPECVLVSVQVHLYLPLSANFQSLRKQIRNSLYKGGFTYPSVTEIREEDTQMRHLAFECQFIEEK